MSTLGDSTAGNQNQAVSAGASGEVSRSAGRRKEDRLVSASRAMDEVLSQAAVAARSDLLVVISGASGVGKKSVARAVHSWSTRANSPVETIQCAGLAEGLVNREIFGAAVNALPSLPAEYSGGLSRTSGGSLVISDADRLPAASWAKLLRVISEKSFSREGDQHVQPLDTRILLTTSNPAALNFGELARIEISIPALAERQEDILPLAAHFLASSARELGLQPVGFTADARTYLLSESWNGNARELRERVRQATELAGSGAISAESLMLAAEQEQVPSFKEAKRAFETRYVEGLLRRCRGNISRAARLAKKDRKDFYDVIRRTGVDPSEFRH